MASLAGNSQFPLSIFLCIMERNSSTRGFMRFPSPLIKGTLIKKYRRFIVDVRLDNGTTVTAHCPTMGILQGVSEPGKSATWWIENLSLQKKLACSLIQISAVQDLLRLVGSRRSFSELLRFRSSHSLG